MNEFFIKRVNAYPVLTAQEERELYAEYRSGSIAARDKLIHSNLRYVISIAILFQKYADPDDLISAGTIGIIHGLDKFEPNKGFRLITYISYWIRAYMFLHIGETWSLVKGSGAFRSNAFFKLRRAHARLFSTQDNNAVYQALALELHKDPQTIRAMMDRVNNRDCSLQEAAYPSSLVTKQDTLVDTYKRPDDMLEDCERHQRAATYIRLMLDSLDVRERLLIESTILSEERCSVASVAKDLGVSRERARQIRERAISKLRKNIDTLDL